MDSWKGETRLAFNYNEGHMDRDVAQAYLADIARYMVKFCE